MGKRLKKLDSNIAKTSSLVIKERRKSAQTAGGELFMRHLNVTGDQEKETKQVLVSGQETRRVLLETVGAPPGAYNSW